jgi:NAD(P)H dehydrogenase (quinone)
MPALSAARRVAHHAKYYVPVKRVDFSFNQHKEFMMREPDSTVARAARAMLLLGAAILLGCGSAQAAAPAAATQEKFIISGASGQLGELTIKELLARGVPAANLILVSRTPGKLAAYAKLGASTRFGDVDQPGSLPAAYAGGTRMLMISLGFAPGAGPRPPRHKLAFDAAVKAGVKRIVYTSFIGADKGGSMLADDHRQSEEFLRASGAHWIALRNGVYAEMQLRNARQMARTGKVSVPPGEGKTAPVLRVDCAAVAAGALLGDASLEDRGYDITGPELVDTRDVARIIGEIIGRPIRVEVVSAPAGGPGPLGALVTPPITTDAVAMIAGRPATGVRDYLVAHKAELLAAAKTNP